VGTIYLSALITHSAWHWMTDRLDRLRQFGWPALDADLLLLVIRLAMLLVLAAAAYWLVGLLRRPRPEDQASVGVEE
jgi:hypothetical protein